MPVLFGEFVADSGELVCVCLDLAVDRTALVSDVAETFLV